MHPCFQQGSFGSYIHSCEEKLPALSFTDQTLLEGAPLGVVTAGEPKNEESG